MGAVVGLCVGVAALLIVLALSSNRPARAPKESYVGALVKSAGLANVTARTVYTTMAIAGLATGSISLIITSLPIVALMSAVGTALIPIFSVKRRARLRSKALRTSWPDAVDSLASSVRAGMSLPEAVADLSKIDLVLVPGLAFSRKGARLGQGRGYYDRFLNQLDGAKTLGVGFDWQLLEHIPEESHDRRLLGVLTESQLFWPIGE